MSAHNGLKAAEIRSRLNHPIIDADGHWLEVGPMLMDYLKAVGGESVVKGFLTFSSFVRSTLQMSVQERRDRRIGIQAWWALPSKNTRDRATAMLPRLLYERLDELGIDFAVLYPTASLGVPFLPDDDVRRATCRALNMYVADHFRDFSDRMTPAAVIPMHTPQEAIAELEHVKQLGLKVVMMSSLIRRPIPALAKDAREVNRHAAWFDALGIDSDYDYDPVWQRCLDLGFVPTFHTGSRSLGFRTSPTNFTYNHIGHFAVASEAVCKALFIGGVTRRFPKLKFAFLEGGVGWATLLYADLIGHWQKRNLTALEFVNPSNLNRELLLDLARGYGGDATAEALTRINGPVEPEGSASTGGLTQLDDYAACKIERGEDVRDLFVPNFYFGCEADDRMNALAFNRQLNPFDARFNVLFGSDIGHFDVPDMTEVVPEAYELVEDGLITEDDFRDFMFTNPVRFWGEANLHFYDGTVVEKQAGALLGSTRTQSAEPRAAK
ncbi:MAG: amidohydrolase family protein [Candidatus Binataceae bacterium]